MYTPGGALSVSCRLHTSGYWITLPLMIGGNVSLWMVLDTGSPVSVISPLTQNVLAENGLLYPIGDAHRYLLQDSSIQGQALPDLPVRVLPRLARIQVDGLLGLDFLRTFKTVTFDIPTLRLTLTYP